MTPPTNQSSREQGQYRKKPVVIEAWRIDMGNPMPRWVVLAFQVATIDWCPAGEGLYINTLEGHMRGDMGDWLIKGVAGELYACKPDIFAATYEPATPPSAPGNGEAVCTVFKGGLPQWGKSQFVQAWHQPGVDALPDGETKLYAAALAVPMPQAEPQAAAAEQLTASVSIDFKQAADLLDMFGGEPTEITLMTGTGHSGDGLYAVYNADPEGSVYLGETDEEATPESKEASKLEPVAWIQPDHLHKAGKMPFLCRVAPDQQHPDFVPLYTAAQLQEAARQAMERMEAMRHAGAMLSNCAFNLAQRNPGQFTARDIEALDSSRKAWDEALRALITQSEKRHG